jgi:hypothetical protein
MTRENQDFAMWSGDTKNVRITVYDENDAVFNISGCTIRWRLMRSKMASASLVTKATGSGIVITDGPNGLFTVTLAPTDTASLNHGRYYHEAEVVDGSGNVATVTVGEITINRDIIE